MSAYTGTKSTVTHKQIPHHTKDALQSKNLSMLNFDHWWGRKSMEPLRKGICRVSWKHEPIPQLSRSLTVDSVFILSCSWILFFVFFSFLFLFLEQLGLGFTSHAVTSVTNWWHSHKTDHGTWENKVEGTRIKRRHTAWITHVGLMLYSWLFRVGCTVASTDHGY